MTETHDDATLFHLDGELVPAAEAKVSILDHSVLYGDGIFETFRVVGGRIFRFDAHLDRLERSAAGIALELPASRAEIEGAVVEVIATNRFSDCYVKLVVTRGAGFNPVLEHEGLQSRMAIIARPSMPLVAGRSGADGFSAAIVSTRKVPAAAIDPRVKSLNYLNIICSRIEARAAGCDESIMLDDQGRVVEGSIYNLILGRGATLRTPAGGCLEGITLDTVLREAKEDGLTVEHADLYPLDLRLADEIVFTSTGVGVVAIHTLDGAPVGDGTPGPLFRRLADGYRRALRRPEYLTPAFDPQSATQEA